MTSTDNGNGVVRTLKKVPIGVWTFLLTQLLAIVIFAVRLDNRVTHLEGHEKVQDIQIDVALKGQAVGAQAIVRNEERDRNTLDRIARLQAEIDALVNLILPSSKRPPP